MSDYKKGTFDADKFQDVFGLSTVDESEAYSEGSGTGSKQTGALGTYMSEKDYNRLKDSDEVWDAYASVNGSDAMNKKRDGGSMSLNTLDALMDDLSVAKQTEETEAPKTLDDYTDRPKDEDHLAAEDAYKENFKNGNPWAPTSAVDSYESAFNNAVAAGREMTALDYLNRRADDKKGGVNRFIDYLGDKNTLNNEEQNYAFSNFMDKAKHLDFKPPTLNDPSEFYEKYKNDIDSIGD